VLLIIAAALYYFYFLPDGQTVSIQVEKSEISDSQDRSVVEEQEEERNNVDNNNVINIENKKSQVESDETNNVKNAEDDSNKKNSEADNSADQKTYESLIKHSYQKDFKNPFKEYRVVNKNIDSDDKVLTIEAIKALVPFQLKGIIGNDISRLAVINYNNQTRIIKQKTVIEEFNIINILDEELVVMYKGVEFKIKLGSGMGEAL